MREAAEPESEAGEDQGLVATPDWARLRTLLVGWPTREDTWREKAAPAQEAMICFLRQLLEHTQDLCIIVASSEPIPSSQLRASGGPHISRLSVLTLAMDDCWLRDTGPVFTTSGGAAFAFNAWGGANGGCYTSYSRDARVAGVFAQHLRFPLRRYDMVLEGGAMSHDGHGTVLATVESVLSKNRNLHATQISAEAVLRSALGVRVVIWLPRGAAWDDDTDGHVDNIAVFARPRVVVLAYGGCPAHCARADEALRVLKDAHDARGDRLIVHRVPTPILSRTEEEAAGVTDAGGDAKQRCPGRVCASYVNFVLAEHAVFVPAFGVPEDASAARVFAGVFPDRVVVPVPAREFVLAGGGLHCLTLGVPHNEQA